MKTPAFSKVHRVSCVLILLASLSAHAEGTLSLVNGSIRIDRFMAAGPTRVLEDGSIVIDGTNDHSQSVSAVIKEGRVTFQPIAKVDYEKPLCDAIYTAQNTWVLQNSGESGSDNFLFERENDRVLGKLNVGMREQYDHNPFHHDFYFGGQPRIYSNSFGLIQMIPVSREKFFVFTTFLGDSHHENYTEVKEIRRNAPTTTAGAAEGAGNGPGRCYTWRGIPR